MTLFFHELKRNRVKLAVWTAIIAFMLCISILIYPQMTSQMGDMGDMFSQMGEFSSAFNMDKINFGEFKGYFAVECGNVLGLGGALFAAMTGISAIAKEEKEATAEFLYTQPLSRSRILAEKYCALIVKVIFLNAVVCGASALCIAALGIEANRKVLLLMFLAYFLLQFEIASICFGVSAFIRSSGTAIGIGIAFAFYFINLLSNITDDVRDLRYVTPFAYCDGADILEKTALDGTLIAIGMTAAAVCAASAFVKYQKKDL